MFSLFYVCFTINGLIVSYVVYCCVARCFGCLFFLCYWVVFIGWILRVIGFIVLPGFLCFNLILGVFVVLGYWWLFLLGLFGFVMFGFVWICGCCCVGLWVVGCCVWFEHGFGYCLFCFVCFRCVIVMFAICVLKLLGLDLTYWCCLV